MKEREIFDIHANPDITCAKLNALYEGFMRVMGEELGGKATEAHQTAFMLAATCLAVLGTGARMAPTQEDLKETIEIFRKGLEAAELALRPNPERMV